MDQKENKRYRVMGYADSSNNLTPTKVPLRVGPRYRSKEVIKPLYETEEYLSMHLDDILIQNKTNNYFNDKDVDEFEAPRLEGLPMLLRKCWQAEKQPTKAKEKREANVENSTKGNKDEQSQPQSSSSSSGPPPKIPRNS